ncbi:hypothetical protein D6825_03130 [Candidatus Woesearchaeota archaeon]|nr:MAG: hypothetical protein D6825_03130 [Candidatus Woesearchaeota archaeon]
MEEKYAIAGILLIGAISLASYLAVSSGNSGAAVAQDYLACCCNVLAQGDGQYLVRSQIQTFADNCNKACERYETSGQVFAQKGLCAENP